MQRLALLLLFVFTILAQESTLPLPPAMDCVHEYPLRAKRAQLAVKLFIEANHADPQAPPEAWKDSDAHIERMVQAYWGNTPHSSVTDLLDTVDGTRIEKLLICLLSDGVLAQERYREHADEIATSINQGRMIAKLPPNPNGGKNQPWKTDPLLGVCVEAACHGKRMKLFDYERPYFENRLDAFVDAAPLDLDDDHRRLLMHEIEAAQDLCGRDFITRLDTLMAKSNAVDEWTRLMVNGKAEIAHGWNARGGGWANTVTDQGWKDFRAHMELARKSLTQAHTLRPDLPHACADLMTVTMANGGVITEVEWFRRALVAQVDFKPAFSAFGQANLPRWGGNLNALIDLAITCIDCNRPDTELPQRALELIFQAARDMKNPRSLYENKKILGYMEKASALIEGTERAWLRDYYYRETAYCAFIGKQFDIFPQLIRMIQSADTLYAGPFGMHRDQLLDLVTLLESPSKKLVIELALTMRGDQDPQIIEALLKRMPKEFTTGNHPYLKTCQTVADFQRTMKKPGTWYDIPITEDLHAFFTVRGKTIAADGTLTLTSDGNGYTTYFQGYVPSHYELEAETQTAEPELNSGFYLHANLFNFDLPGTWFSFRISTANDRIGALLGPMMRVTEKAPLPSGGPWNRLEVRCTPTSCDLAVNGQKAFTKNPWPEDFRPPGGNIGIGGYCENFPGMVIQFRKIRIRALPAAKK